MKVEQLSREFTYQGITLPDPGVQLSPEQVRDVYSAAYPEITSAVIEGPERKGNKLVYVFKRAVGTKGATLQFCPAESEGLTYIKVQPNGSIEPGWVKLLKMCRVLGDRFIEWFDSTLMAY